MLNGRAHKANEFGCAGNVDVDSHDIPFQERRWWASCNAHHPWSKQMIRSAENPSGNKEIKKEGNSFPGFLGNSPGGAIAMLCLEWGKAHQREG